MSTALEMYSETKPSGDQVHAAATAHSPARSQRQSPQSGESASVALQGDAILVRAKIQGFQDWIKHQALTFNLANAALLVAVLVVSTGVNSTLRAQEAQNDVSRQILRQINDAHATATATVANITTHIQQLSSLIEGADALNNTLQYAIQLGIPGNLSTKLMTMENATFVVSDQLDSIKTASLYGVSRANVSGGSGFVGTSAGVFETVPGSLKPFSLNRRSLVSVTASGYYYGGGTGVYGAFVAVLDGRAPKASNLHTADPSVEPSTTFFIGAIPAGATSHVAASSTVTLCLNIGSHNASVSSAVFGPNSVYLFATSLHIIAYPGTC